MTRKAAAVVTAVSGGRVIIGETKLHHAIKEHFSLNPRWFDFVEVFFASFLLQAFLSQTPAEELH